MVLENKIISLDTCLLLTTILAYFVVSSQIRTQMPFIYLLLNQHQKSGSTDNLYNIDGHEITVILEKKNINKILKRIIIMKKNRLIPTTRKIIFAICFFSIEKKSTRSLQFQWSDQFSYHKVNEPGACLGVIIFGTCSSLLWRVGLLIIIMPKFRK